MHMAHGQVRRTRDDSHPEQRLVSSSRLLSDGTALAPRFYVTDANSGQLLYDYDLQHRTFTSQPVPPYEKGDMWTDGKDLRVCVTGRGTGPFFASDWILATDYSSDALAGEAKALAEEATKGLADYVTSNAKVLADLQNQMDGSISTWFYAVPPTTTTAPVTDWTTPALRNDHLGDLYYDTTTGYCYRYMMDGTEYVWSRITDTDVTKALAAASTAQDTADGKRRVFVVQPTPPYDVGDQWAQGGTGDLMVCRVAKAAGTSYAASDWDKASKYTDDTAAKAAQDTADQARASLLVLNDHISAVVTTAKDAATITITSTHGLVFKSNAISTTLIVTVYQPGGNRIDNQSALVAAFGATARIEWKWQREDEDGWSTILASDSRLSNNGFSLTVSPADVDVRTSFEASVVVD